MMPVYRESSDERAQQGYWKGFWNNADRPTMRYEILGVIPEEGQWKWKKEVADEAVDNYIEYSTNYSTKMSLEEYWESTGKNKRFIRRNPKGTGKNKGVEHWVAPASGILRNSNWSDMLISKPIGYNVPFDSPKNPDVIVELISLFGIDYGDIVLDFFSGSATTAHAVMKQNFQDVFDGKKGKRKFIMVQLPEKTDEKSEAYKAGYQNICEIGKERIRRAGKNEYLSVVGTAGGSLRWNEKRKAELGDDYFSPSNVDIGFRVLKLDSSNMKDVYYNPADFSKNLLDTTIDNIKEDRTPEDLLFQVMLDLGVLLSSKIEETEIAGKKVFNVADGFLIACFDKDINEKVITAVAKQQPIYFVMRDSSLSTDTTATNFDQIFETYSPDTVRKVI